MQPVKWPPDWWTTFAGTLGPWDHRFFDGLIPIMDVRQFIYEFARELVDWIPHQGNEYTRQVMGTVGAVFSGGARPLIPLGRVGYNAKTHKILWEVNRQGGPKQQAMYFDVQNAIPTIFQLIMMVPWDFVGEAEANVQGRLGSDKTPRAKDIVSWLYGRLRDGLADIGIAIPAIPGNYASSGVSWSDIVIPAGVYTITNGPVSYTISFNDTTVIRPKDAANDNGQIFRSLQSTAFVADAALAQGNKVELVLPPAVFGRENLDVTIIGGVNGITQVDATAATRTIVFTNGDAVNPVTLPAGSYSLVAGRIYPFTIPSAITLSPLSTHTITVTADTTGHDPTWIGSGPVTMSQIQPSLPSAIFVTYSGGVNGLDAVLGRRSIIDVSIVSKSAQAGMLLPAISDLALYNIPVINFCQSVYESAVELVDTIEHHGPAFMRHVIVGGVYPKFIFRVFNSVGVLVSSGENAPQTADLINNRLVVSVAFYEDDGSGKRPVRDGTAMERVLLDHTFATQSTSIDFEATTTGPDDFFDAAADYALDQVAATGVLNAFLATVNTYTGLLAQAEVDYGIALAAAGGDTAAPDVVTAQAALTNARNDIKLVTERRDALARRISTRDPGVIKADIVLPTTLSLANVRGDIVAQEQGFAAVTLSDGAVLSATPTKFRVHIQVEATGRDTQNIVTIPASFPAFRPANTFGTRAQAVAARVGQVNIPRMAISSVGAIPWLSVQVQGVVNGGLPAPDDANEPGAEKGRRAVVEVVAYNDTPVDVTAKEEEIPAMYTFTVAGETFVVDTPQLPTTVPAIATKTYTGIPKTTTLTDQVLSDVDISFSAPIPNTRAFVRWRKAAELDYIGEEFNISNPWQGSSNGSAFRRFLQCRLRYKMYDRISSSTGEPLKTKNFTVIHTQSPQRVPEGNCRTMRIDYDAEHRLITIHNLRNNSSVTMHTSSAIWFMLQILLLVPVEVI